MPPARRDRGRTRAEVGTRHRRITPARAVVLAVAFEVVLAGVDVATGSSIVLATAYVLAPLALATVAAPRQVLAVAVLALALAVASGAWNGFLFSTDHVVRVLLVTLAGALAVLSAGAREREARAHRRADAARRDSEAARAEAEAERARAQDRAQTLQASLLPDRLPTPAGWELAAMYRPGVAEAEVGGDFYDVLPVGGGLMVLMGDVTGKGVKAAALTSLVRYTARTAARYDAEPAAVLEVVDQALRDRDELSLVTMVCAVLRETGDGVGVTLASGGHPLPLRLGRDGRVEAVGLHGVLLGAVDGADRPEVTITLHRGETLLFFTDGLADTPGSGGRFGEQRLVDLVAACATEPGALVAAVVEEIAAFEHGATIDDRAALAVRYVGVADRAAPAAAGPR
jgi:serine phosphatase RsbU (regulator of sigma subunit)